MIVLSVEINCLRGIKNLKLDFNGKNAVIYGIIQGTQFAEFVANSSI